MAFRFIYVKPVHTENNQNFHLLIFLIEIPNQNQFSIDFNFFFKVVYIICRKASCNPFQVASLSIICLDED